MASIRFRRPNEHVHTPAETWAVALLRQNVAMYGGQLRWRCECGEMVEEEASNGN